MKSNFKLRLAALLLCLVMLFSASCAAADPTPTNSQPTTATTKGTTSDNGDPSTPGNDDPTTPEEPENEYPENGAKTILTETKKLYASADYSEDLKVAYYEGVSDVLLVDTDTMVEAFFDEMLASKATYEYEETETEFKITRNNGAYCIIDFVKDTIYFSDLDRFTAYRSGGMADFLGLPYVDSEGNNIYLEVTSSLDIAGLPVQINLAPRDIPLDIYEGKKYIPLQTLNDIFFSPFNYSVLYNTEDLFFVVSGAMAPDLKEMYYSVDTTERSEEFALFAANELCLLFDLYYGLKNEHGLSVGFKTFFEHIGLWDDLTSTDAKTASQALVSLTFGYLADKHTSVNMASPLTGSEAPDIASATVDSSIIHYAKLGAAYASARAAAIPQLELYKEIGNTAYITIDTFTIDAVRAQDYNENSVNTFDTMGLIIYAHSQITRENSPIENVVIDLSNSPGGASDAGIYLVSWMLGYCDLHLTNPLTGSYATTSFKADVNLDGVFDEKDTIKDKNLYCIVSPVSFSCANLVPSLLKESGKVTILGNTSGGGACAVQFGSTADGSLFAFSSPRHLSVVSNGAYYTVDRGVEPHHYLSKIESFYDRVALTDFINNLK